MMHRTHCAVSHARAFTTLYENLDIPRYHCPRASARRVVVVYIAFIYKKTLPRD